MEKEDEKVAIKRKKIIYKALLTLLTYAIVYIVFAFVLLDMAWPIYQDGYYTRLMYAFFCVCTTGIINGK